MLSRNHVFCEKLINYRWFKGILSLLSAWSRRGRADGFGVLWRGDSRRQSSIQASPKVGRWKQWARWHVGNRPYRPGYVQKKQKSPFLIFAGFLTEHRNFIWIYAPLFKFVLMILDMLQTSFHWWSTCGRRCLALTLKRDRRWDSSTFRRRRASGSTCPSWIWTTRRSTAKAT